MAKKSHRKWVAFEIKSSFSEVLPPLPRFSYAVRSSQTRALALLPDGVSVPVASAKLQARAWTAATRALSWTGLKGVEMIVFKVAR